VEIKHVVSKVLPPQPLSKEVIDQIFAEAKEQADYGLALYKVAIPCDWERIVSIKKWPKVSKATSLYLFEKAIEFDGKYHPDVLNGGLWMNRGFSSLEEDDPRPDWMIFLDDVEVTYVP